MNTFGAFPLAKVGILGKNTINFLVSPRFSTFRLEARLVTSLLLHRPFSLPIDPF